MKFFLLNTAVFVLISERNCAPLGKQVNFIIWSRKTLLIKFQYTVHSFIYLFVCLRFILFIRKLAKTFLQLFNGYIKYQNTGISVPEISFKENLQQSAFSTKHETSSYLVIQFMISYQLFHITLLEVKIILLEFYLPVRMENAKEGPRSHQTVLSYNTTAQTVRIASYNQGRMPKWNSYHSELLNI